ncbi:MAG TPA: molecular chaperone DnaJ, partial [Ruminococcaceae bacterium]|nr:molecular chaperone DnaJ [Oscillospiraceae bacterium]
MDVRELIMQGRVVDAEQILDGVPPERRNAEWFFLKGTVLYRRGWLEEAYGDLARACQMDPSNAEYRAAFAQVENQRRG